MQSAAGACLVTDLSYSHTHYNGKEWLSAFYPAEDGHSLLSNLHIVLRCRSAVCHTATLLELEMNLCEVLLSDLRNYARQALNVKRR